jgi:hypothetical protein
MARLVSTRVRRVREHGQGLRAKRDISEEFPTRSQAARGRARRRSCAPFGGLGRSSSTRTRTLHSCPPSGSTTPRGKYFADRSGGTLEASGPKLCADCRRRERSEGVRRCPRRRPKRASHTRGDRMEKRAQNLEAAPAITRSDVSSRAKLLTIPADQPDLRGFRCFIALSEKIRSEMGDFFLQPHKTSIVWGGQKVLFIFMHHSGEVGLYYDSADSRFDL